MALILGGFRQEWPSSEHKTGRNGPHLSIKQGEMAIPASLPTWEYGRVTLVTPYLSRVSPYLAGVIKAKKAYQTSHFYQKPGIYQQFPLIIDFPEPRAPLLGGVPHPAEVQVGPGTMVGVPRVGRGGIYSRVYLS